MSRSWFALVPVIAAASGCFALSHPGVAEDAGADSDASGPTLDQTDAGEPDTGASCSSPDLDGDGYRSAGCGGDDCDDRNADVHPRVLAATGEWRSELVGPVGTAGQSSLRIGADGLPRVAYCAAEGLLFSSTLDGGWGNHTTWVEAEECRGPSLALLGDGSFCATVTTRAAGETRWTLSIARGGDPDPPITPGAADTEFVWWVEHDDAWAARGATSQARFGIIDGAVAYHADGEVRVRGLLGASVSDEVVDPTCETSDYVSAAFDDAGRLHAAWVSCLDEGGEGVLRYGTRDDIGWTYENIAPFRDVSVAETVLSVDAADHVHIVMRSSGDVLHASNEAGAWESDIIEADAEPTGLSMAVGPDGVAHVAFVARGAELDHATRVAGAWELEPLAPASGNTSISVGDEGTIGITYRDGTDLWIALRPGTERACF